MPFPWTCPYCDRDTTITDTCQSGSFDLTIKNSDGCRHFESLLIVCPNPKCRRFTLTLSMRDYELKGGLQWTAGEKLHAWNLIPPSQARVFPDYVPKPIRDDYLEACLIRDLSPKASATLSRRCLQGMIRDYWKVTKPRLVDEIEAIKAKVEPSTWQAIDDVRTIGNIGAHMEKDINVIVDVDPDEAQILIELIELLIKDWYVTRHERSERMKAISAIKAAKLAAKSGTASTGTTGTRT